MKPPKIGTIMYCVREHYYYIPGRAAPLMEYVVFQGTVKRIVKIHYTEIVMEGTDANGCTASVYCSLSKIGKKCFYTPEDAALYAKQLTQDYEDKWSWMSEPDIPLRRTWESYLNNNQEDEGK